MGDDSLLFFGYGDFEWEFVGDPARPLGRHVGRARRESAGSFDDFWAKITVFPQRLYPGSRLKFSMECKWHLDGGNNSFLMLHWPRFSPRGQAVDAVLEEAKLHAYEAMKRDYEARQYHLMP